MKFSRFPLDQLTGAVLGHSIRVEEVNFKKGRVLSEADVAQLHAVGVEKAVAAILESGDVPEDVAATRVTEAAMGQGVSSRAAFTGRCNIYADVSGMVVIDRARVDSINLFDESVTIATLEPYEKVGPRQMVATVKVIPFSAPEHVVDAAVKAAQNPSPLIKVVPFRAKKVGLILTQLRGTKDKVLLGTIKTVTNRIEALGSELIETRTIAHQEAEIAKALRQVLDQRCDMVLVSGASAIVDRRDVVPMGIEMAGGHIDHFGMPVDPGNLLLLGHIINDRGLVPVLGLPGCARSPKLNGFDWVLERLIADQEVTAKDIMGMGAGGLLKEIPSRPQPRNESDNSSVTVKRAPVVGGLLLAAGQSRRMGRLNKLLEEIDGIPMICHIASALGGSGARPLVVVTGHEAGKVQEALKDFEVEFIHNSTYGEGLSTSLQAGVRFLADKVDGIVVCQGDMPRVSAKHIDLLLAAFDPAEGRAICVPTAEGKRGNPVLWASEYFSEILALAGDVGARHLIGEHSESVYEVEMEDLGVLLDIDTPEVLSAVRSKG